MYRCTVGNTKIDWYFNESHTDADVRSWVPFDIKQAYEYMVKMRNVHNEWEKIRVQRLKNENTLYR